MARDSKKKISLDNSSIVIVCEGTETENKYLEVLAKESGRTNKRHQEARKDAENIDNLHIAFSAYSIEEWFLLHFERNAKAFDCSECK